MGKLIVSGLVVITTLALATISFAGEIGVNVAFSDGEVSIIRAYYRDQGAPQKGKKKNQKRLPPGIARNLERGKPLPPGIAKQALPAGLVDVLPRPPHGFERVVLNGRVLLVEVATQVIHDVLEDVILDR